MYITKSDKTVTAKLDITAKCVVECLKKHCATLSTAESCTGGLLSGAITSVSGASEVFELGVCSYSCRIKNEILGVDNELIEKFGVVSSQVAEEMAKGVRKLSGADVGVGITGIAGPTGACEGKPIGTVYVCVVKDEIFDVRNLRLYDEFEGLTRDDVRQLTVLKAFEMICGLFGDNVNESISE